MRAFFHCSLKYQGCVFICNFFCFSLTGNGLGRTATTTGDNDGRSGGLGGLGRRGHRGVWRNLGTARCGKGGRGRGRELGTGRCPFWTSVCNTMGAKRGDECRGSESRSSRAYSSPHQTPTRNRAPYLGLQCLRPRHWVPPRWSREGHWRQPEMLACLSHAASADRIGGLEEK